MATKAIVVGTRGSRLARLQTEGIVALLRERHPAQRFDLETIRTTGDRRTDVPLTEIGGEGVFTKEIEAALLDRRIDFAVHSLKDLPTIIPDGLTLAAIGRREDPRDALVSRDNVLLARLPVGARIGTDSLRRRCQLRLLRPDVEPVSIRGNVDTRIRKVEAGEIDGIIVAAAALTRLGRLDAAAAVFDTDAMLPAPGQGALVIEARADDATLLALLATVDDADSRSATTAERAFLRRLGGGCRLPIAALGVVEGGQLWLRGLVADESGERVRRAELRGPVDEAESLGVRLAEDLLT